jgi:hypothetical protein
MAIFSNSIIPAAAAAADDVVTKSLRFNDGDTPYLSRTPASDGNRKTWTWSGWVKRSGISTAQWLFNSYDGSSARRGSLSFLSTGQLFLDQGGSGSSGIKQTLAKFRDVSAWYHVVVVADYANSTEDDRAIIYINNNRQSTTTSDSFEDADGSVNAANAHQIGSYESGASPLDGYLADVYFIDGTALTPTSFAEEDATTGQWKPKAYSGSYGDNGFHLDFEDDTDIGNDVSGNDNDFTVTNLAASDVVEDTPTNSYCTLNPLDGNGTYSEGNLEISTPASGYNTTRSTFFCPSGTKWYWEFVPTTSGYAACGITTNSHEWTINPGGGATTPSGHGVGFYGTEVDVDGVRSGSVHTAWASGDIIGFAYDVDADSLKYYINGTLDYTYSSVPTSTDGPYSPSFGDFGSVAAAVMSINFGQDSSFAGLKTAQGNADGNGRGDFYYAPPTGFLALSTANLPTPTIAKPSEYFDIDLWSGTSAATRDIATPFDPVFVWIKCRSHSGNGADHTLWDSLRGVSSSINTGLTSSRPEPEGFQNNITTTVQYGGVSDLGTEKYTLKEGASTARYVNETGRTYVGWSWRGGSTATNEVYNATSGFSIVKWTGDDDEISGDAQRVSHSLGVAPELILAKNRWNNGYPDNRNWQVYHKDVGAADYLILNSTSEKQSYETEYSIAPYSTTDVDFRNDTAGGDIYMNEGTQYGTQTAETYVAYLFASVEGYSLVGSYEGNSSTNGPFVYCGFRPAFILIKNKTGGYGWFVWDTVRNTGQPLTDYLYANTSAYEETDSDYIIDVVSNGFLPRAESSGLNNSSYDYIYYAVAESPFKYANAR